MLTITRALELSIVKWKFLVEHPELSENYHTHKIYPEEIKGINAGCGLCEFYKVDMHSCSDCPLKEWDFVCCYEYYMAQDGWGDNHASKEDVLLNRYRMLDRLQELLECAKKTPKGWLEED